MPHLSLREILESRVPLSTREAVAIALSVAERASTADPGRAVGVPPEESILLSSSGHVSFAPVPAPAEEDSAAALARLLHRLLRLDSDRSGRAPIPGSLVVLLARALRQIDLPPPGVDAFRSSLARFGTADPAALAAVFWRVAQARSGKEADPARAAQPAPQVSAPIVHVHAAALPQTVERRQGGPSRAELRRALRDAEVRLFVLARRLEARAPAPPPRGPSVTPASRAHAAGTPVKVPSRRLAVAASLAMTLLGTLAGTLIVFLLAGAGALEWLITSPDTRPAAPARQALHDRRPPAVRVQPAERVAAPHAPAEPSPPPAEAALVTREPAGRTEAGWKSPRPIVTRAVVGRDVFSPSFTPGGRSLLFHAGRDRAPLMRASLDESGAVNGIATVLADAAANYHATMSPDGRLIAFDSDRDGERGVYVARADGTEPRRISGAGYAAVPSWSPEGRRVAFVRAEPKRPRVWNVWLADLASGELQRVTRHALGQPWGASWFPDGRRVAYSREDELVLLDLRTGAATRFRSPLPRRLVRTPAVSPDGRQVAFQVQRDGLWLLDVPNRRMRRVLADPSAEEFVWAPDGDSLAYHSRRGGSWAVWRVRLTPERAGR